MITWPNTNERFSLEEFLRANCEYPGTWDGTVERIEQMGPCIITAVHVWAREAPQLSFSCGVIFSASRRENSAAGGILGR